MLASYLVVDWLHWTASITEGAAFCPYWNGHTGYGFTFPAHNVSAKTIIHRPTECLIHHHSIPHNIASDQGTHFTAKEVGQWAYAHGIHWSYIPSHPEAAGLREWWTGLLKAQLQYQLGSNTSQSWGKLLQKAVSAPNQHPTYDAIFLTARMHRSRNQGGGGWEQPQ